MTCKATQQSDEMFCAPCGLRWDVNDQEPPKCQCETNPPRLIGLCGYAGHGKTTAALHLAVKHKFHVLSFAAPLKAMMSALLHEIGVNASHANRMIRGDLKEHRSRFLNDHTARHAMQTLGTDWARRHMGEDFWINAARQKVYNTHSLGKSVVFDDVRFENEAEMIRDLGGIVIMVRRATGTTPIAGGHVSENPPEPDRTCYNSGSEQDMRRWFDYHVMGDEPQSSTR